MKQKNDSPNLSVLYNSRAEEIFEIIRKNKGITKEQILAPDHHPSIVACRIAFTVAMKSQFPKISYYILGTLLGGLDPTSIYHYKRVCKEMWLSMKDIEMQEIKSLVSILENYFKIEDAVYVFIRLEPKPRFIHVYNHLRYATLLFKSIEMYTGFSRKILRKKYGKDEIVLCKIAFVVLYKELFPEVSHKFVASLIGTKDHARICYYRSKHKELNLQINSKLDEVIGYKELLSYLRLHVRLRN